MLNSTVTIDCVAKSDKEYTLIWKRELPSSVLVELLDDRIRAHDNGTLQLM